MENTSISYRVFRFPDTLMLGVGEPRGRGTGPRLWSELLVTEKILISAGEASGDLYAASLVETLRRRFPEAEFFGCAGPRMRQAGVRAWSKRRAWRWWGSSRW